MSDVNVLYYWLDERKRKEPGKKNLKAHKADFSSRVLMKQCILRCLKISKDISMRTTFL